MPLDTACLLGSVAGWSLMATSVVGLFGDAGAAADTVNITRAAFGGAGGFIGSMCIALFRQQTSRVVLVAVALGTMLGVFAPPWLSRYMELKPEESGLLGLVLGLIVLGLLQAFSKLSDRVGRDGDKAILARIPVLRDVLPPDPAPAPPEGKTP